MKTRASIPLFGTVALLVFGTSCSAPRGSKPIALTPVSLPMVPAPAQPSLIQEADLQKWPAPSNLPKAPLKVNTQLLDGTRFSYVLSRADANKLHVQLLDGTNREFLIGSMADLSKLPKYLQDSIRTDFPKRNFNDGPIPSPTRAETLPPKDPAP